MIKLCLILFIVSLAQAEKVSYEGYRLIRITPKTENHIKLLDIWEDNPGFDVWNGIKTVEEPVDVVLSPKDFESYEKLFNIVNLPFEIIEENIQRKIDEQQKSMEQYDAKSTRNIVGKYARYTEIISFISNTVIDNPDIASSYRAGDLTEEGRELRVLVLKTATSRRSIWLDCGIHAREWVAPSSCIWFIDRLIKDFRNSDPVALNLLNYYEFHILPLVNPDGYDYSHTTNRLWRKNKRPSYDLLSPCVGTDLNRNYGYQWMVAGASTNPCSDTYAGRAADSEVETKAVQKAINAKLGNWDSFITIHSYGNFWMVPYGWGTALPPDYADLTAVSKIGADALKSVYGTTFSIGSPANLLYSAAGGSFDWTYARANIKYSIALELRPGQTGPDSNFGFTLPEDRAPLAGEETYIGLKAMIEAIRKL